MENNISYKTNIITHTYINTTVHKPKGIIISLLNICSLFNKTLSLLNFIEKNDINIMALNETWLSDHITNASLFIPNYKFFRVDRPSRGGGIMFLLHNRFQGYIESSLLTSHIELLHISIDLKCSLPINLITLYRPPSSNLGSFYQSLRTFLNNIDYIGLPLILLGDINVNMLIKNSKSKEFTALINDYSLQLMNNKSTYITMHSSTLLDVIVCNKKANQYINNITTEIVGFSDHNAITFGYKKPKPLKHPPRLIYQYNLTYANEIHFLNNLQEINIDTIFADIDINNITETYMTKFNNCLDKIPHREVKISGNQHRWINLHFIQMCTYRDNLFKLAKTHKNISLLAMAKQLRNKCNAYAKSLKCTYFSNYFTINGNNPKKMLEVGQLLSNRH